MVKEIIQRSPYDIYFLSNLYDDDVIVDSVRDFNHYYPSDLYAEGTSHRHTVQDGTTDMLIVDNELNYSYGVAPGSYSLRIPYNNVAWYSEVAFVNAYGYGKPISSLKIMSDMSVFNKTLLFFIGNSFLYEVYYVIEKTEMILFIVAGNHLTHEEISSLLKKNDSWTLLYTTKGMNYRAFSPSNTLITNGDRIYLKSLKPREKIESPTKKGRWTLFISSNPYSYDIMSCTNTPLLCDENGELYFEIGLEFLSFIYTKTRTLKCLIINDPDCCGSGIYVNRDGVSPIFQIPYKRTPYASENIIIWEYDKDTKRKLHPLVPDITVSYPNIYDFSKTNFEHAMYIEWSSTPNVPNITYPLFQDYIDYCGKLYSGKLLSGNVPTVIKEYEPASHVPVLEMKYPHSPYFGDYRSWKIYQLVYAMKDNPLRYRKLFNRLYRNSVRYISSTYTPEEYPEIYQRSIMNNKDHCDSSAKKIAVFTEPHTYIKINNDVCQYRHCALFIDGMRKVPTYNMTYDGYMYIYFPVEWIKTENQIQLDIGLIPYTSKIDDIEFRFNYLNSIQKYLNTAFSRKRSLSDIIFCDEETGDFINDDFDISLSISIYDIDYKNKDLSDEISFLDTDAEMMVKGEEKNRLIFGSDSFDFFIVKRKSVEHHITDALKSSHKNIDLTNLVLSNPSIAILEHPLHMILTDFYASYIYDFTGNVMDSDMVELWERGEWNKDAEKYEASPWHVQKNDLFIVNGNDIILHNYKGSHSKNHFRIFVNGKLQNPNMYTITFPSKYGGDCIISTTFTHRGYLIIDYLPYEEEMVYNGSIANLKKTNDSILYLHDYLKGCPFDNILHRIYIDGIRVSRKDIIVLGSGSSIMIRNEKYSFTDASTITIYQQAMDSNLSPYDYDISAEEYLMYDEALIEDADYRKWVIDKYLNK